MCGDGRDNDCDGKYDEEEGCPCVPVREGDRLFLLCDGRDHWQGGPSSTERCAGYGYKVIPLTQVHLIFHGLSRHAQGRWMELLNRPDGGVPEGLVGIGSYLCERQ